VGDEAVQLHKAALIEQQVEPFPRRELALLVLLGNTIRTTTLLGERLPVMEFVEKFSRVGHRVGR